MTGWWLDGVSVDRGGRRALDGVSIGIEPGRVHAVVGGDGAGKSTLLQVVAGLDLGQTGRWRLPPPGGTGFAPARGGPFPELTVDENLAFVARVHRLERWRGRAEELVDRAGLGRSRAVPCRSLSGGQQRKLAAALALLPGAPLVVLDEVTTGVDPASRMEVWRMVAGAVASGAAVVTATSYLDEAERAGRVTLLHRGRVLASGDPDGIVADLGGSVVESEQVADRSQAWRRGRWWRSWRPDPIGPGDGTPVDGDRVVAATLEDAAVVRELEAEAAGR